MTRQHHRAAALLLTLCIIAGAFAFTGVRASAMSIDPLYISLLDEIYTAINNGFSTAYSGYNTVDVENSSMSEAAKDYFICKWQDAGQGGSNLRNTIYALADIDGNGVNELLLSADLNDPGNIDVVYTIRNGKIVTVETYAYRSMGAYCGNVICSYGSMSANMGSSTYYKMINGYQLEPIESVITEFTTTDTAIYWYYTGNNYDARTQITKAKFDSIVEKYANAEPPVWYYLIDASSPYFDVRTGDWYCNSVMYVYKNGFMTGTSGVAFSPDNTLSRAMLATVLYRVEGQPAVSGTPNFSDVPAGEWYSDAVLWASENGIVGGYGNGQFGTNDSLTREQLATMLHRYAGYRGYDLSMAADLSGYSDSVEISSWAVDAMSWAVETGLISGNTATTLNPSGSATRAQCATILMRFIESIA